MPLDFTTLDTLRSHHPAWRLLRSDHAALVASFLHRVFVAPNVRGMAVVRWLPARMRSVIHALSPKRTAAAQPNTRSGSEAHTVCA